MRRLTVGDYVFEYEPDGTGDARLTIHSHPRAVINRNFGGHYQWEIVIPMPIVNAFWKQHAAEVLRDVLAPDGTESTNANKMERPRKDYDA